MFFRLLQRRTCFEVALRGLSGNLTQMASASYSCSSNFRASSLLLLVPADQNLSDQSGRFEHYKVHTLRPLTDRLDNRSNAHFHNGACIRSALPQHWNSLSASETREFLGPVQRIQCTSTGRQTVAHVDSVHSPSHIDPSSHSEQANVETNQARASEGNVLEKEDLLSAPLDGDWNQEGIEQHAEQNGKVPPARYRKAARKALQKELLGKQGEGEGASTLRQSSESSHEPRWKAQLYGREETNSGGQREYLDLGKRVRYVDGDSELIYADDYDLAVDVRSPGEFAEDHVIGAINCPVLDNEERAIVGTIYKQESPFKARRIGAAMVAKNIAQIFDDQFVELEKEARVLVYCWRGGERSGFFAHTVSRVGWPTFMIKGGYKTYRSQVREFMAELDTWPLHVISGKTGSGKGLMLEALRRQRAQVLDLEAAANHRGSILGDAPGGEGQPSQKLMESHILHQMRGYSRRRMTFVEGESSLLGKLKIPKPLVLKMRTTTHTQVHVPMEWRVKHTSEGYTHFWDEAGRPKLKAKLDFLRRLRGNKVVDRWFELIDATRPGWEEEFCEDILREHYDPAYLHSFRRDRVAGETVDVEVPDLEEATLDAFAKELLSKYDQV